MGPGHGQPSSVRQGANGQRTAGVGLWGPGYYPLGTEVSSLESVEDGLHHHGVDDPYGITEKTYGPGHSVFGGSHAFLSEWGQGAFGVEEENSPGESVGDGEVSVGPGGCGADVGQERSWGLAVGLKDLESGGSWFDLRVWFGVAGGETGEECCCEEKGEDGWPLGHGVSLIGGHASRG